TTSSYATRRAPASQGRRRRPARSFPRERGPDRTDGCRYELQAVRRLSHEQGQAMIVALGVLVVLGMLGVVVMTYTTSGQRTASRSSAGVSAYSLAEAGINNSMSVLAKQKHAGNALLLPDDSVARPANVSYYDSGSVKWWGTYDSVSTKWTLSAIGSMANPTGGSVPVTRRI